MPYKDGQDLGPILPRERVLEHYESHVLKCPDCQKGLKELRKKQTAALYAGVSSKLLPQAAGVSRMCGCQPCMLHAAAACICLSQPGSMHSSTRHVPHHYA